MEQLPDHDGAVEKFWASSLKVNLADIAAQIALI